MLAAAAPPNAEAPSRLLARPHVLCSQAWGVAVSGSYAYVTTHDSASLTVVDISNPASPAIRGSVASSSLLDRVRVRPGALRARMASGAAACVRTAHHARARGATADALLSAHLLALTCYAHRRLALL
jgi:hypothetical protein